VLVGDSEAVQAFASSGLPDTPSYNGVIQNSNELPTQFEETASSTPDLNASSGLTTSKEKFPCRREGCGKTYGQKSHLKRHEDKVHLNRCQEIDRFRCSYEGCKKSFGQNVHLKRHQNTHYKVEKLYTCPYCHKCQSRKYNSEVHQLTCQKNPQRKMEFLCPYEGCREPFSTRGWLTKHKKETHKDLVRVKIQWDKTSDWRVKANTENMLTRIVKTNTLLFWCNRSGVWRGKGSEKEEKGRVGENRLQMITDLSIYALYAH